MTIEIAGRLIGADQPPFVIAEMSGNHNQSLERALAIVDAAAQSGAHAIKLQTYTADTMTLDTRGGSFEIRDSDSPWAGQNLHDLYKRHTPRGNGISRLWSEPASWASSASAPHLMRPQSTFLKA